MIPNTYSATYRRPIDNLAFGDSPPQIIVSTRIAPVVFGVALPEAIPEAAILAQADPDDMDGDDISGRANMVWDVRARRSWLGRLGWKANRHRTAMMASIPNAMRNVSADTA